MLRNLIDSLARPKPKNKFSLENLHYLYEQLVRYPVIDEENKEIIIETLRQLAEVMIWGDQHSPEFFDFFLEKNLLGFFKNILDQKTNNRVKVQLLQTLSILVENIRNQNSTYYLFSNNHINELITHKFDFSDDEILSYYISFLKTLSLKLNKSTIQFFFNAASNDFPLYTEAIKFFNHKDSMIRIAVRTLTLNVYKVEDEPMRRYILDKTAAPYFSNIVWYIRDQCFTLDNLVINSTHKNKHKLNDFVSELLDFFFYLHDILNLGINQLSDVLYDHLTQYLLLPQFVGSLIVEDNVELEDRLSPLVALFLIVQVFYIFNHKLLLNTLTAALVHPNPAAYSTPRVILPKVVRRIRSTPNLSYLERSTSYETLSPQLSSAPHASQFSDCSNKYYDALLSFLEGDDRMVLSTVCLFYAMVKCKNVDRFLLEIAGLFPFKLSKAKRLLESLITTELDGASNSKMGNHNRSLSESGLHNLELSELSLSSKNEKKGMEQDKKNESSTDNSSNSSESQSSHNAEFLKSNIDLDDSSVREKFAKQRAVNLHEKLMSVFLPRRIETVSGVIEIDYRVITLQMNAILLKELVCSQDSSPNLSPTTKKIMMEAYKASVNGLLTCFEGPLGDIFLEMFEQELKIYKQVNFDALLNDFAALLLPVSSSSMSGIALAKRLPSGEAEKTQRATQTFLVLREFKYTMLRTRDESFPLKEVPMPSYKVKDTVSFENKELMSCSMLIGPASTRKKVKRFLWVEGNVLIIAEPDPRVLNKSKNLPSTMSGVITNIIPVQSLEIQQENSSEAPALQLTNHIAQFNSTLLFVEGEDFTTREFAEQQIETARSTYRAAKHNQILQMLSEGLGLDIPKPIESPKEPVTKKSATSHITVKPLSPQPAKPLPVSPVKANRPPLRLTDDDDDEIVPEHPLG